MKALALVLALNPLFATSAFADDVSSDVYNCSLQQHKADDSWATLQKWTGVPDSKNVIFADDGLDYKVYHTSGDPTLELEVLQTGTMNSVNVVVAENSTMLSLVVSPYTTADFKIYSCAKAKTQSK